MNDLLKYFHRLNQARLHSDLRGARFVRVEAKRVREKILFSESSEVYKKPNKIYTGDDNEFFKK